MSVGTEAERVGRVEKRVDDLSRETSELRGAYRHLATKADVGETKADIAELKSWIMWRMLIGAAVVQGIIAALIKYLPD